MALIQNRHDDFSSSLSSVSSAAGQVFNGKTKTQRWWVFMGALLVFGVLTAQNPIIPKKGLKRITQAGLYQTMSDLTSQEMAGRAPGTPGGDLAADYIEKRFKDMGLAPFFNGSYRQPFMLYGRDMGPVSLSVNNRQVTGEESIYYLGHYAVNEPVNKEVVYIGDGNDSVLSRLDLTDKLVLVNLNPLTRSYTLINKLQKKQVWGVLGFSAADSSQFDKAVSFNTRIRRMIGLSPKEPAEPSAGVRMFILNNDQLPVITGFSAADLAQTAVDVDRLLTFSATIQSPIHVKEVTTWNIAGVLKGENSKEPPVVVTAHYDHIGQQPSGICWGADDNASGVATIIEVAKAYRRTKSQPQRDIVFVAFGAEEVGLVGSEVFMDSFVRKDVYANINIDMIGRRDTLTKENYIYIMGTHKSPELHRLHQDANIQTVNLNLDYAYERQSGYGSMMNRSDHYHFYKKDIPVIAFFSGLHDDYHTPLDTLDKIDFPLMTRRVQLVFGTLFLLANSYDVGKQ